MPDSAYTPIDSREIAPDDSRSSTPDIPGRSSALQEYGPRPLALLLNHYHGVKTTKDKIALLFVGLFSFLILPHTLLSFIFTHSHGRPLPVYMLLLPPLYCYRKSSPLILGSLFFFVYSFDGFSVFQAFIGGLVGYCRVLLLCTVPQLRMYSAVMMTVHLIAFPIVIRSCVIRVRRDDALTLKRNWHVARVGGVVLLACVLLLCSLDSARMHPLPGSSTAPLNVTSISIATSFRSIYQARSNGEPTSMSACMINSQGRLLCTNNAAGSGSDASLYDVIGMHDFSAADWGYGFGLPITITPEYMSDFGRSEHVVVGGTHVCAVATRFHRHDRQLSKMFWFMPWYDRDSIAWTLRNHSVVVCWGRNNHGQLGLDDPGRIAKGFKPSTDVVETPDEVSRLSPPSAVALDTLPPDDKVVHLAAGHCHTCALTRLGSLFCWGCNAFGQVGSPDACPLKQRCGAPAVVSFQHMNHSSPVSAAAAADNTCAILGINRVVACWGRDNRGQLGRPSSVLGHERSSHSHGLLPQLVEGLPGGAASLAIGREHICALFADGALRCWGSNQWGQLGASSCGGQTNCLVPVVVPLGQGGSINLHTPHVIAVCAGNRNTCCIIESKVHCLGGSTLHDRVQVNHSVAWEDLSGKAEPFASDVFGIECAVNDDSAAFARSTEGMTDELVAPAAAPGTSLAVCARSSSGHVGCVHASFCDDEAQPCASNITSLPISFHERELIDVKGGSLIFLEHAWHLVCYYLLLSRLLTWLLSRGANQRDAAVELTQLLSTDEYQHCVVQLESMGFCSDAARHAAAAAGGDILAATSWLAEHPGAPYDAVMRSLGLRVTETLGRGGFGVVYRCISTAARRTVAVKVVSKACDRKYLQREGQRLANCSHENIVQVFKVHSPDAFPGVCVLEMEFVGGGDLHHHLKHSRLPRDCVLMFTRQLLNALAYLHECKQLLHGDIKPQNILVDGCSPPSGNSTNDYSRAVFKLADFGLAKSFEHATSGQTHALATSSALAGGTEWYMSSEALKGRPRVYADDIWSACLVILEMDSGLPLQQLMQGPGSVSMNELFVNASQELLPLLYSVLSGSSSSRRISARDLLRHLDMCIQPIFEWQVFNGASFVPTSAAASFFLESAFISCTTKQTLQLPPPLDLSFDIHDICFRSDGTGTLTQVTTPANTRTIRRIITPRVLQNGLGIPVWQQLVNGKGWLQHSPHQCAKLERAFQQFGSVDAAGLSVLSRRVVLQKHALDTVMIPFPLNSEPYCVTLLSPNIATDHAGASPFDAPALTAQVHASLPEFDITHLDLVVNQTIATNYAAYKHSVAMHCNGDPNERYLFHYCPDSVVEKIWREGEGHDSRLSQWAEVGKGAYFSEHAIYGYAYKFNLWEGGQEPGIGESFRVFVSVVALGNCRDLGVGCGTCTSPQWEEWKQEFAPMNIQIPTRPPLMSLATDAAEQRHRLDLMRANAPRYDSVTSTEGDLGTAAASTYTNKAKTRLVRDVMHPRLLLRPRDWGRQYVVFGPQASYPMFILTLTKRRSSPVALAAHSP